MNLREDNKHITSEDLFFPGVLNDVGKSRVALQPIFEAFTNAIEAIKDRIKHEPDCKGEIIIDIYTVETTAEYVEFNGLTISDNGVGFSDKEYRRFNTFKDFTKGYNNLGSGRIQFVHYFNNTIIKSIFSEDGKYLEREFIVSKNDSFLNNNAIVFNKSLKETKNENIGTKIAFNTLLENSQIYNELTAEILKNKLIERYLHYFCCNKTTIPTIKIKYYVQSELIEEKEINNKDIPDIDKTDVIDLPYSQISSDGKSVEKLNKTETFNIDAFKVSAKNIKANTLSLVSKGEIAEEPKIVLQNLSESDAINGFKYLFFVSGNYINLRDTNMRGVLSIPNRENFPKNTNLFSQEEIILEEIQDGVNSKINAMYPEILDVKNKHVEEYEKLKKMFFLDDETAKEIVISITDNDSKILEKYYGAEAKKIANIDASIKKSIDRLDKLDTTAPEYGEQLHKEVEKLVKSIPLQNKMALTHYVARRKLVLDLFDKVLNKKLEVQQSGREFDEELIHDLLFQQGEKNPENSDLWIVNEDFIYFKGNSNIPLNKVNIDGKNLFKDTFTVEEERYLNSLGEKRKIKKPDVLLFPDEGKCIIIEFKAPDVNVSDHLTQIDKYASLIRNHTEDKFQITTFYGYLLGENIEPNDVRGAVSSYEVSYQFDYLFRPSTKVIGFTGRSDGSIYTEVIKYTTLLARARNRNKIFLDKLQ